MIPSLISLLISLFVIASLISSRLSSLNRIFLGLTFRICAANLFCVFILLFLRQYFLFFFFEFFFAGNLPFGKRRRVERAVGWFEVLRERWNELRPGARDPQHCPNTYENFMFELAEGYLVLGDSARAEPIYRELSEIDPPRTRAKELIARVSADRLAHMSAYLEDTRLMPPWPSDVGNCVVCHAYQADIPLDSLHTISPFALDDVPTQADPKPVPTAGAGTPRLHPDEPM